jgi:hypothetical protein
MGFIVTRGIVLAILATIIIGAILANEPITAFRKEFIVSVPRDTAWAHFNRVTEWPTWASHVQAVELVPAGELGPATVGTVHLKNGESTVFRMTAFEPRDHWQWSTTMLWFTLDYDHLFERVSDLETRIVLHMKVKGFGKNALAFVVGRMAGPDLDASSPTLIRQMNSKS